jgi:ParB-like chromosome segregation protein Spo0J
LAAIDDTNLMVEAYKIILKESGSVRRAEELARRMKAKSQQPSRATGISSQGLRVVSEEIDKMQEELTDALAFKGDGDDKFKKMKRTVVKLARSRRETRVYITFKGGLEDTEERLKKLHEALT